MLRQYNAKVATFIWEWILAGWDVASTLFRKKKKKRYLTDLIIPNEHKAKFHSDVCAAVILPGVWSRALKQICLVGPHVSSSCTKLEDMLPSYLGELHYEPMARLYVLGQLMMNSTTVHREQEEMTRCTEVLWLCAAEVGMAGWSGWTHIVLIKTSDGANSSNGPERKWQKKRRSK